MSNFEERSGAVSIDTPWGLWFQTIGEVFVEVNVDSCLEKEENQKVPKITSMEIKCTITNRKITLVVRGKTVIQGDFPQPVHGEDSLWTLEDKKLIRIFLPKARADAAEVWPSLLVGQYEAGAMLDQMKRKMTLERFQMDNPGLDFSHSTISGNYEGGGPKLS